MTSLLPDAFFRSLDAHEVIEFKRWAHENFDPEKTMDGTWHPVVRAEWERIAHEAQAPDSDTQDS